MNSKNLIPSFQINHTKLKPGIYESRVDAVGGDFVTTFDIRMKYPNTEPAVHPNAMHTVEHIIATYLRDDEEWKDRVIYWGPMGCLTGCYFIVKGRPSPRDIYPLIIRAFEYLAGFEGTVPGTLPENCGNYILHDLEIAKYEAVMYVKRLKEQPCFEYPVMQVGTV